MDDRRINMFGKFEPTGYTEIFSGVELKTRVYGSKTLLAEFRFKKGHRIPSHQHPFEQTGYLISGNFHLTIGDECFDVAPGDCWCIPSDMAHGAEVAENSVVVEVFSPVREDYLPENLLK
jgi:quercetin dioxygenase-like cupin family protein